MSTPDKTALLLDTRGVEEALSRMARAIMEDGAIEDLMLVGIHRRGVELAERIGKLVSGVTGREIPTGSLDITLYRDDFDQIGPRPAEPRSRATSTVSGS